MSEKKQFYDLDEIRAIPILDVCDFLGLPVEKRGRNYWCKVRPENKASVILHTDTNYFYDFGNQEHGNNIGLVQYACGGLSAGDAIRKLAMAFNLSSVASEQDLLGKPLNLWEYRKIGLHGDLATKNLVFPVTTATADELLDMEYAYRMSMNELRSREPEVYQWLLKEKAIPYVKNKREAFYLSVWNHYDFLRSFGNHTMFFESDKTRAKFEAEVKDLEQSERALYKACQGTGLDVPEPSTYDPLRVLSHLMQGRLEIPLGSVDQVDIQSYAEKNNWRVYERVMSYDEYSSYEFDGHPHAATFQNEKVKLLYLESEKDFFEYLCPFEPPMRPRLDLIINAAEQRKSASKEENCRQKKSFELSY